MTPIEIGARGMVDTTSVHDRADDFWRAYEGQAKAALTALSEAGWSLVPSEADHDVTAAVVPPGEDRRQAAQDYKAMIEAGAYKV